MTEHQYRIHKLLSLVICDTHIIVSLNKHTMVSINSETHVFLYAEAESDVKGALFKVNLTPNVSLQSVPFDDELLRNETSLLSLRSLKVYLREHNKI